MSFVNTPLPVNFDWPTLPAGEAEQAGTLELLQAQGEWLARVGLVTAPETQPSEPKDDLVDKKP